jgi:hypothetical protein
VILHYLLLLLVPGWQDIIENPATKKVSSKNLFGALGYFVAIFFVAWAQCDAIRHNRQPDNTAILLLLLNGLGLATAKIIQLYLNRKTKDEDGALAQPVPPAPPQEPQLMPQAPQELAGYNDGPASTTAKAY